MDGYDIRKYLKSGAAGVQMGTAFLCCNEAGTNTTYKKYVLEKKNVLLNSQEASLADGPGLYKTSLPSI